MSEISSNYGIEIVVGMIFAVLATLFYRVIYFSYFKKIGLDGWSWVTLTNGETRTVHNRSVRW